MKTGFVAVFIILAVIYALSRSSMNRFLKDNREEKAEDVSDGLLFRVVMLGGLPTIGLILAIVMVLLS